MLTTAQLQALKTAILADQALAAQPMTSSGAFAIAEALNLPSNPAVSVWRSDAPVQAIIDAIVWSNYTPNDAPDNTATFTNRLLAIQTKQMNLQLMLQGRETLNANNPSLRLGLRDAVINVPSGAGGAATSPGGASGVNVLNKMVRTATRGEAILAGSDSTTGTVTAKMLGCEGSVSSDDVQQARELP